MISVFRIVGYLPGVVTEVWAEGVMGLVLVMSRPDTPLCPGNAANEPVKEPVKRFD